MEEKSHKWVYITLIVVIVALMIAGAVLYRDQKQTKEAKAAATEFVHALKAAGLPAPTVEEAVRMFGADGGSFAQSPDESLVQSQYAWQLGTAGPASRPVILDPDFVKAAEIFVLVYAPEKLAGFREFVSGLDLQETTD
jgi:hypothetical protein